MQAPLLFYVSYSTTVKDMIIVKMGILKIKNNYAMEFYYGSGKGAVGASAEKADNDYDIASTLIGVLLDRNIPARYAKGKTIAVRIDHDHRILSKIAHHLYVYESLEQQSPEHTDAVEQNCYFYIFTQMVMIGTEKYEQSYTGADQESRHHLAE